MNRVEHRHSGAIHTPNARSPQNRLGWCFVGMIIYIIFIFTAVRLICHFEAEFFNYFVILSAAYSIWLMKETVTLKTNSQKMFELLLIRSANICLLMYQVLMHLPGDWQYWRRVLSVGPSLLSFFTIPFALFANTLAIEDVNLKIIKEKKGRAHRAKDD